MGYVLTAALAYLIGTSNMALYLSRLQKVDLRAGGSGNLGASNTVQLMGWRAGVLVGVHDMGKAVLAVLLAQWLFPGLPYAGAVAGVCSVLGHIFPFYMNFRGGKGFASYFGMTLALNWKLGLALLVIVLAVTLITDYIVVGTVTTTVSVPAYLGWAQRDWVLPCILLVASAVIWYKHRENFVRLCSGTELGLRSAMRGEHKVKK